MEKYLLVTNLYPHHEDIYRNGFVHSRVKGYKQSGIAVDVFQFRPNEPADFYEYESVKVLTGGSKALREILAHNGYRGVMVHFMDVEMWRVLKKHLDETKIIVWIHGFEIQPWYRRRHVFESRYDLAKGRIKSMRRVSFWRELLRNPHDNLRFIFISKYLLKSVMEDYGLAIPEEKYEIIHNYIDTEMFRFIPKESEQRKKILSIRPYANRNYANDLSVEAILELSQKPFFNKLEFRLIGNGVLFDETVKPLRGLENVIIEKGFLPQHKIARLHQEYGVFLSPTRMDTQGVSRGEAMSSGLVPVTNSVAAVPEFVDEKCGVLAEAEDAHGLAEGIARLYEDPELFSKMSKEAAHRVRRQCAYDETIARELDVITS